MFKLVAAAWLMAGSAQAETMTCSTPQQQAPRDQLSVSGDALGQHFVFRISVDGVPLDQAQQPKPKVPLVKADCDYIS